MIPPPLSCKRVRRVSWGIAISLALLPILIFLIWRIVLARQVSAELNAIREAGLPSSGKDLNDWYAAVPAEKNSALVMTQAFDLMRNFPDDRSNTLQKIKFPRSGEKLTAEEQKIFSEYLRMNREALAKVGDAIQLPETRYPVDWSMGLATPLPHLPKLKECGRMLQFQSCLAEDSAKATEAIQSLLVLARSLETDPCLISQLVRIALINMATLALEHELNENILPKLQLTQLAAAFSALEKTDLMTKALIADRAMYIPYFRMNFAEMQRFGESDTNDEWTIPPKSTQWTFLGATGFFERDLLFYLRAMETSISLASLSPPKSLLMTNVAARTSAKAKSGFYIFSGMFLPALGKVSVKEAYSFALIRLTQIALALEQFREKNGELPETLNSLSPLFQMSIPEDPFDGKPLRYKRLEKGYVIYSVGSDAQDNSGLEKPSSQKPSDQTAYDITFTVKR